MIFLSMVIKQVLIFCPHHNLSVAVEWELQFQLLISKVSWASTHSIDQSVGPGKTVAEVWKGPLPQKADTVNWALPLTILPSINTDTLLVQRQHIML